MTAVHQNNIRTPLNSVSNQSATLEGPTRRGSGSGNGGEGERGPAGGNQPPPRVPVHRDVYGHSATLQRTSIQHTATTDRHHQTSGNHHLHSHHQHQQQYMSHPQVIPSSSTSRTTPPPPPSRMTQHRHSKTSQQSLLISSSSASQQNTQKQFYEAHHPNRMPNLQKSLSSVAEQDITSHQQQKQYHTKLEVTTCCCISSRCHREHGSMFATLLGSISLTCLLAAIITDTWIHTEEPFLQQPTSLLPPFEILSSSSHRSYHKKDVKLEFTIGLWKVCPALMVWQQKEESGGITDVHPSTADDLLQKGRRDQ